MLCGLFHGTLGDQLGHQREHGEDGGPGKRRDAEPEMKCETDGNVKRQPGQIEQRGRPASRQERADRVEIAKRLRLTAAHRHAQLQADHRIVNPGGQKLIEPIGDAHQQTPAHRIEKPLKRIKHHHDGEQRHQCRQAAARQDAVIDLHHEQRAGEIKNIDQSAHQADADESTGAAGENALDLANIIIGGTITHFTIR
jgi:hypothetical protein